MISRYSHDNEQLRYHRKDPWPELSFDEQKPITDFEMVFLILIIGAVVFAFILIMIAVAIKYF